MVTGGAGSAVPERPGMRCTRDGAVAVNELQRPRACNALDVHLRRGLPPAVERAHHEGRQIRPPHRITVARSTRSTRSKPSWLAGRQPSFSGL